ncbi:MAG TPA: agmatine deiminase family protein, partial [Chitinophagaceae bacterium]
MQHEVLKGDDTPRLLGYHFPAEFEPHEATWLSWPHKEASWPARIASIYSHYAAFVKEISAGEKVRINVNDAAAKESAVFYLVKASVDLDCIEFYFHPTNDAWCRDHGPAFVVNRKEKKKMIIDWAYNAWGNKYPPFDLDDEIPTLIARALNLPVV